MVDRGEALNAYIEVLEAVRSGDPQRIAESSLSRVWQLVSTLESRGFVIMTAWQGSKGREENIANNLVLTQMIRSAGYGFVKLDGVYQNEAPEPSFLIPNASLRFGMNAMLKFNQQSIVYGGPETKGRIVLVYSTGATEDLGGFHPDDKGVGFSRLKSGRAFRFEATQPWSWVEGLLYERFKKGILE